MVKPSLYFELLCEELLDRRDKVGFETPMGDWVAELAGQISSSEPYSKVKFLWDEKEINTHFQSIINNGKIFTAQDWRLLNLKLWMQMNIE